MISPQTKMASLQIHVNPLVSWIWLGCIILIGGSIICMWPQLESSESRVWAFAKSGAAVAASIAVGIFVATLPSPAYAQSASSLHTGTVRIENAREKLIFSSLRCMCGDCARQLLSECGCPVAEDARTEIRSEIAGGMSDDDIIKAYMAEPGHGAGALAVPPNQGFMRAIWALPLGAVVAGGVGLVFIVRRWRKSDPEKPAEKAAPKDEYDSRLDEELKDLDG
jgi:cytochrome c-type biogenesis protein CcmH/NrfF